VTCNCLDPLVFGHVCRRRAHQDRVVTPFAVWEMPDLHSPTPRPEPWCEPTDGRWPYRWLHGEAQP